MKPCKVCGELFVQYNTIENRCPQHRKRPNIKLKPLKPLKRVPVKKVSDKRKIQNLQYSVLRIEFLGKPENKICPVTGQPTTEVHHKAGRVGDLFLDTRYWLAVSRLGHQEIELNPEWAKEKGYSLDRLTTK